MSRAKTAMLALAGDVATPAYRELQRQIEQEEAALGRLKKHAPSPELEKSALVGAKALFQQQAQARKDRAQSCAAKAAERRRERAVFLESLQEQTKRLATALQTAEEEQVAAHVARAAARAEAEDKVLALFGHVLLMWFLCLPAAAMRVALSAALDLLES